MTVWWPKLTLPLSGKRHATIVSAYAPTMTNQMRSKTSSMMIWNLWFLLHPGQTNSWENSMLEWAQTTKPGKEWLGQGVGKCNSNGLLLLKKCAEHELLITNTVFICQLATSRHGCILAPNMASHWLCHSTKEGQTGCQSDKDYVWCRLLDRSQACCQQTQPAHSACTATTKQESAKETGCLQAEIRQQDTSLHQWYLQPIRCNGTLFRWSRRELDSLQRPHPLFSNGFPRTSIS